VLAAVDQAEFITWINNPGRKLRMLTWEQELNGSSLNDAGNMFVVFTIQEISMSVNSIKFHILVGLATSMSG
jgi:hypothetical protein